MRSKNILLDRHLESQIVVKLPSGRKKRVSRRKAYIYRLAVGSANGDWAALNLLLKIAERAGAAESQNY